MQPGLLKHKVEIKQKSTSVNSFNETVEGYNTTFATLWCDVRSITADKRFNADRDISYRAARFLTYYIAGVTNEMRLSYEGDLWEIIGVAELGFREGLEITAEVRSTDARDG